MYGSVTIGNKNTFDDFRLIPTQRLTVALPEVKTNYVDASGVDGPLDLTTALTGTVLYGSREGSWEFMAANRYGNPQLLIHEINNYLHGKKYNAVLERDPGYYYTGRFSAELGRLDRGFLRVIIKYVLEPFKRDITSSLEDWLWDPFNFETGIIREYKNMAVPANDSLVVTIPGSSRPTIPVFTCSADMTVTFNGSTYTLSAGTNRVLDIVIGEDEAELTFAGEGTVSVDYRGGWL